MERQTNPPLACVCEREGWVSVGSRSTTKKNHPWLAFVSEGGGVVVCGHGMTSKPLAHVCEREGWVGGLFEDQRTHPRLAFASQGGWDGDVAKKKEKKETYQSSRLVFKSPVRSRFFPLFGQNHNCNRFPILKKSKNRTGTVKDRSDPVFIGSSTGLDRFSLNRTETGPSQSRPMVLPYHSECLYIITYIIIYILYMQGSNSR